MSRHITQATRATTHTILTTLTPETVEGSPVNMRHASAPHSGYTPATTPRTLTTPGLTGAVLVDGACYRCPDGSETLFLTLGDTLYARNSARGISTVGVCAPVTAILPVEGGVIVLRATEPPVRYDSADGSTWALSPLRPRLPQVAVVRRDMGVESITTCSIRLGQTYDTRDHSLTPADSALLGGLMREAYTIMADNAAAKGRFIQPVVARCRLIGAEGRVLYTTPPVLVSPADGIQCTPIDISLRPSSDTVGPLTLGAASFRLEAVVADGTDLTACGVEQVQMVVSPQLHPLDRDGAVAWRYLGSDGGALHYRFAMQGHSADIEPGSEGSLEAARIAAAIGADISMFRPLHLTLRSVEADMAEWQRIMEATLQADARLIPFSAPHSFAAARAASNGDAILYGDLTAIPFDGYALPEFTVSCTAADGTGRPSAIAVTMDDGTRVVRSVTCTGFVPGGLSPLLLYPSPRARSMLIITPQGRVEYPLVPSPCGRWAYWINPGLKPHTLPGSEGMFVIPAATARPARRPNTLLLAHAADPASPRAAVSSEAGAVTAVTAAPRAGTALGYTRASFYAMGRQGIAAVSAGSALTTLSSALLDPRAVTSHEAVTLTPDGVMAIAGGDLVRLNGTKVTTILTGCGAGQVAYCPRMRELWLVSHIYYTSGQSMGVSTRVLETDHGTLYTRTTPLPKAFVTGTDALYLQDTAGQLYNASAENDLPATIGFEARVRVPPAHGWQRMRLRIPLTGRGISGKITIHARQADDSWSPRPVATLTIGGHLTRPPVAVILVPRCHTLVIRASLSVTIPSQLHYDT